MTVLSDNLTLILGTVALAVYLAKKFISPVPLVHPLVLGRQSLVSPVRNESESPVYRNHLAGSFITPLPALPSRDVTTIPDLLRLEDSHGSKKRRLWSATTTNKQLADDAKRLGSSLIVNLHLNASTSRVLLLLNNDYNWLVSFFALAYYGIPLVGLSTSTLLHSVLEEHSPNVLIVGAGILRNVLEMLEETTHDITVVVIGDEAREALHYQSNAHVTLIHWELLLAYEGTVIEPPKLDPENLAATFFFSLGDKKTVKGARFTHANIVAGVTGIINSFTPLAPWSEADTVLSSHAITTSFGLCVLLSALYTGAHFASTPSSDLLSVASSSEWSLETDLAPIKNQTDLAPTILFVKPRHIKAIVQKLESWTSYNPAASIGLRHKRYSLYQGHLARDTFWDQHVFLKHRATLFGAAASTIRLIVVADGNVENDLYESSRLLLSVPIVNMHIHPLAAGPLFTSHPFDFQVPSNSGSTHGDLAAIWHYGPPAVNIEVKLSHLDEHDHTLGGDMSGMLSARGPGLGSLLDDAHDPTEPEIQRGWLDMGEEGTVDAAGVFRIKRMARD